MKDTYARFYVHPQLQGDESIKQGRDVYKDVIYVEVMIKGDKNTSFSRPMQEQDKEDYPKAWAAYKENDYELSDGTPIKMMPGMSPSAEIELRSMGINSVEDLAALHDGVVLGNPGMVTLRKRAQAYVAACMVKPEKEESTEQEEEPVNVEEMENTPEIVPKRKRGRPRKNVPTDDL
jgi:hypothetical protein